MSEEYIQINKTDREKLKYEKLNATVVKKNTVASIANYLFNVASDLYIDIYHVLESVSSDKVSAEELKDNAEMQFGLLKEKIDEIVNKYRTSFTNKSLKKDKNPSRLANFLNGIEDTETETTIPELERLKATLVEKEKELHKANSDLENLNSTIGQLNNRNIGIENCKKELEETPYFKSSR